MTVITIETGAVSIPTDHKVWKCFPGQAYRFYQAVIESHSVFLDINDLPTLGADSGKWADAELYSLVQKSREREENRLNTRKPDRKKRSPKATVRLDNRNFNMAQGLYQTVQAGDLVVVPAEGYDKDVYIGRVSSDPLREVVIPQDGDRLPQHFYGKPVIWLASVTKGAFSTDLISLLHTPIAFFDIGRTSYEEVYRIAFENFVNGETSFSTFHTSKPKFRNYDNLISSLWLEYLIAASAARFSPDAIAFQKLGLLEATSGNLESALGEELFLNVNSPGTIALRALSLFPIVASALWALSALPAEAPFQQDISVVVEQVTRMSPKCDINVTKETKEYLNTIGLEKWKEACEVASQMRQNAQISAKSRIRP